MNNKRNNDPSNFKFQISEGGKTIKFHLIKRKYPNDSGSWDKEIIFSEISFSTPSISGRFAANIWSSELSALVNIFSELQQKIGQITSREFELMEEGVKLSITKSKTGHVDITVTVCPNPSEKDSATFVMKIDQSYLPNIIKSLEDALRVFP